MPTPPGTSPGADVKPELAVLEGGALCVLIRQLHAIKTEIKQLYLRLCTVRHSPCPGMCSRPQNGQAMQTGILLGPCFVRKKHKVSRLRAFTFLRLWLTVRF